MIGYTSLAQAAFDNDSRASEGIDKETLMTDLGFYPGDVIQASNQRALRLVLAQRGRHEIDRMRQQSFSGEFSVEHLTDDEMADLARYQGAWIDGLLVAAQAIRSQHG